jgi:Domain of unknown function (DUF4340)
MNPFLKTTLQSINRVSPVKKALFVFVALILFVLVVEQPGSPTSKYEKGKRLLFPQLVSSDVVQVQLSNLPDPLKALTLKNDNGQWRVVNGHSFPADRERLDRFLSVLENLVGEETVSNNPDRTSVFGITEYSSPHIVATGSRDRVVADFFVGNNDLDNLQYVKKAGSDEVILASEDLRPFVQEDLDGWKDKTLLALDEGNVSRLVLSKGAEDTTLEKSNGNWSLAAPVHTDPDSLALRTLFEQIKQFKADRFADTIEGSQADFDKPDYKISAQLTDGSTKEVVFKALKDKSAYFAKDGDKFLVYVVSKDKVENLFGLKLKAEAPQKEKGAK